MAARQFATIAVCGALCADSVFETDHIPKETESREAKSLTFLLGGKGASTAIAAYRASHSKVDRPVNPAALTGLAGNASRGSPNGVSAHEDRLGLAAAAAGAAETDYTYPSSDGKSEVRVFINGAVGDDRAGQGIRKRLEGQGINVEGLQTIRDMMTGTRIVMVDSRNKKSCNLGHPGANSEWRASQQDSVDCLIGKTESGFKGPLPSLLISHLGIERTEVERILILAGKEGVDTLLHPSPACHLGHAVYQRLTHLILDKAECQVLFPDSSSHGTGTIDAWKNAAGWFMGRGVKNVVITLGARGAYFATQNNEAGEVEAEQNVQVVDTTGASDTFIGTYAVEYVRMKQIGRWDISKAVKRACHAAARTIEQLGAQESIPWSNEIDESMERVR